MKKLSVFIREYKQLKTLEEKSKFILENPGFMVAYAETMDLEIQLRLKELRKMIIELSYMSLGLKSSIHKDGKD